MRSKIFPGRELPCFPTCLTQRPVNGKSTPEHRQLIIDLLKEAGSMAFTLDAIRLLQDEVTGRWKR